MLVTRTSVRSTWFISGLIAFLAVSLSHLLVERASVRISFSSTVGASYGTSIFASSSSLSPTDALVEWFHANGGYLHESVEIRRQDHEDSTSPYGVFAKSDIEKGEIVLKIPSSLYLQLDEKDVTPEDPISLDASLDVQIAEEEKAMEVHYSNTCKLAHKLRGEMELYQRDPSSSKFAAYMRYLNETQPRGQIPAAYSPLAKEILREIQSKKSTEEMDGKRSFAGNYHFLPLVDWIDEGFVRKGCIEADDADGYHAIALAIQRGFDTELLPIWDMLNHDNGRFNVVSNSIHGEETFQAWTSEAVHKGQELFASYNFCYDCVEERTCDLWGLPGIFRDFGFIEDYPQYWPFPDQNVFALIEELPGGASGLPAYHARFFQNAPYIAVHDSVDYGPDLHVINFFETQLDRLRQLNIEEKVKGLTAEYESYMITRYFNSLMNAMETIVSSAFKAREDMGREAEILIHKPTRELQKVDDP